MEFKRPKDFDLAKYDDDGRFGFGDGLRVKLNFCITKAAGYHLLEARLSADQVVEEFDEHYRIEATVVDSAVLERWLRGFGADVWDVEKSPPAE